MLQTWENKFVIADTFEWKQRFKKKKILSKKVCQWLAPGRWFSPGTPVSSTNKTDGHDITKILLKQALSTIKQTLTPKNNNNLYNKERILVSLLFKILIQKNIIRIFIFMDMWYLPNSAHAIQLGVDCFKMKYHLQNN